MGCLTINRFAVFFLHSNVTKYTSGHDNVVDIHVVVQLKVKGRFPERFTSQAASCWLLLAIQTHYLKNHNISASISEDDEQEHVNEKMVVGFINVINVFKM